MAVRETLSPALTEPFAVTDRLPVPVLVAVTLPPAVMTLSMVTPSCAVMAALPASAVIAAVLAYAPPARFVTALPAWTSPATVMSESESRYTFPVVAVTFAVFVNAPPFWALTVTLSVAVTAPPSTALPCFAVKTASVPAMMLVATVSGPLPAVTVTLPWFAVTALETVTEFVATIVTLPSVAVMAPVFAYAPPAVFVTEPFAWTVPSTAMSAPDFSTAFLPASIVPASTVSSLPPVASSVTFPFSAVMAALAVKFVAAVAVTEFDAVTLPPSVMFPPACSTAFVPACTQPLVELLRSPAVAVMRTFPPPVTLESRSILFPAVTVTFRIAKSSFVTVKSPWTSIVRSSSEWAFPSSCTSPPACSSTFAPISSSLNVTSFAAVRLIVPFVAVSAFSAMMSCPAVKKIPSVADTTVSWFVMDPFSEVTLMSFTASTSSVSVTSSFAVIVTAPVASTLPASMAFVSASAMEPPVAVAVTSPLKSLSAFASVTSPPVAVSVVVPVTVTPPLPPCSMPAAFASRFPPAVKLSLMDSVPPAVADTAFVALTTPSTRSVWSRNVTSVPSALTASPKSLFSLSSVTAPVAVSVVVPDADTAPLCVIAPAAAVTDRSVASTQPSSMASLSASETAAPCASTAPPNALFALSNVMAPVAVSAVAPVAVTTPL